jgi:acid phosphatase
VTTKFHRAAMVGAAVLLAGAGSTAALIPASAAGSDVRTGRPDAAPAKAPAAKGQTGKNKAGKLPGGYKHLVVIYEENHSFDNLYGSWGNVNGQHVDGLSDASHAKRTQVAQNGTAYACLPQNDANLSSPPLSNTCQDAAHGISASHFHNAPFSIDDFIKPADKTCPAPGVFAANGVLKNSPGAEPGGCTEDIVHRFYQEQYQIHGGKQDRYTTGSDAVGLTLGTYRTKSLPIYRYLHGQHAPKYVVADRFFQGAFGGSFLNHQFVIAARAPVDTSNGGDGAKYSVLDTNGMPTSYPQYKSTIGAPVDGQLTRKCADPTANDRRHACGSFAVNTVQPAVQPKAATGASIPLINDAKYPNIGDRMSAKGVSWNWYSGGWDDANSGHPGALFQYHHQPFNYFANYAPGRPGRTHLKDEKKFMSSAKNGTLPTVSFVKPYGAENEHPGYASESNGSDHLVHLLKTIRNGPEARDTLVVVTYDEFGGQWDHVSPPKVDAWGPGTRIPALVLGGRLKSSGVDHTVYDTTSILATIEHRWHLEALGTRDANAHDLRRAFTFREGATD